MLSCHGVEKVVECEAKLLWDEPIEFSLFGISRCEHGELGLHYRLFPRALDNSAWLSNVDVSEEGVERYISLHNQENDENFGLNVVDQTCWARLGELFDVSLRNETIFLETAESETEKYQLLGDMIVSKEYPEDTKEVSKRWFYGLGYGYYGNFYRHGLYGAYPYYSYYGKRDGKVIAIDDVPATMKRLTENLETLEETTETKETDETEETEGTEGVSKRWFVGGRRNRWGGGRFVGRGRYGGVWGGRYNRWGGGSYYNYNRYNR